MAYSTIAELKTYLGITGDTDDALFSALLDEASSIIDRAGARVYAASVDATRYFDSYADVRGATLYLDRDLAQITSITNGDADVLTASEYVTEPRNDPPYHAIKLLSSSGLSWTQKSTTGNNENAITIVGRWAYAVTAPSIIARLNVRAAAALYKQRENPIGETVLIDGQNLATPKDVYGWIDRELQTAGLKKIL